MRVALDTNTYSLASKGDLQIIEIIRSAEEVYLPFIVLAELRAGFRTGTRALANEKILIRFLNQYGVGVLYPDENSTHHYAALFQQMHKQRTVIPASDLWIATLIVQHDLVLCSRDKHFDAFPQIPRL